MPKAEIVDEQSSASPSPGGTVASNSSNRQAEGEQKSPGQHSGHPTPPYPSSSNDYYQCSICYKSIKTAKAYKIHMAAHKPPLVIMESPPGVGGGYSNESGGSNTSDTEKWQACKYCNKIFYDLDLLKAHILDHITEYHIDQCPPGRNKCMYCFKMCADGTLLRLHLQEHNDLKDYKCLNCNKIYASLNYLKLHYKMHADEKPYKCTYCDKRFTFSSNLYVHHRIHTGHKPYRCEKCAKSFSQINSLKQHNRIHRDSVAPSTSVGDGQHTKLKPEDGLDEIHHNHHPNHNVGGGLGSANGLTVEGMPMNRPPVTDLSIQDVIIQQLQQRTMPQSN